MKKILVLSITATMMLVAACKKDAAPIITILGDNPMTVSLNLTNFIDPGATANDAEDGDLTNSIEVFNNVDFDKKGSYTIQYKATDGDGNSGYADRIVYVSNTAEPVAGEYTVVDNKVDPQGNPTTTNYIENISTHDTVNNRIWFIQFAAYEGALVYADVDGDIISIPQQEVNCGIPQETRRFIGTGNIIDGTTIIINYTEIKGGQNWTGSGNYTRQ